MAQIVAATTQSKPRGATRWSTRSVAKAQGVSKATIQRIWSAHGLQPHRTQSFKRSKDPRFTEKLTDVVGRCLNPPDKAVILCVDAKTQVQALRRTQPGLPMKKGRCGAMTHEDPKPYVWHASVEAILNKIARSKATYEALH